MRWNNALQKQLNVQYPIIQAPMLGVTSPAMAANVSNAGALGSLPVGGMSPADTRKRIEAVQKQTDKPFAVNLFTYAIPDPLPMEAVAPMQEFLRELAQQEGVSIPPIALHRDRFPTYEEQIDCLLELRVPIVSFTFGIPDEAFLQKLKQANVYLIGTATSPQEAVLLERAGVDAVVAQGIEAGGHRGSFLSPEPLPEIGSMSLISEVVDQVAVPVIAAGGIVDGRGIVAAKVLGALGFQIGSLFLRSPESEAPAPYQDAIRQADSTASQLTRTFTGRWARGIRNAFMRRWSTATYLFRSIQFKWP